MNDQRVTYKGIDLTPSETYELDFADGTNRAPLTLRTVTRPMVAECVEWDSSEGGRRFSRPGTVTFVEVVHD